MEPDPDPGPDSAARDADDAAAVPSPASLVLIGASRGGVGALQRLAAELDPELPVAWCVTLHIDAHSSVMPALLTKAGRLSASFPEDGDPLVEGHIHVAPPDRHMVIEDGRLRLVRGPRENWSRPAIDPMFRSAGREFRSRAIGVVLTGTLNDGSAGLLDLQRAGGTAVVQDPADAEYPDMPANALRHVEADHKAALAEMPGLLARLSRGIAAQAATTRKHEKVAKMPEGFSLDTPPALSCPDCHGTMSVIQDRELIRFRCHIGHLHSLDTLLHAQLHALEERLGSCVSLLNERAELCRLASASLDLHGGSSERLDDTRREAIARAETLIALIEGDWKLPQTGS